MSTTLDPEQKHAQLVAFLVALSSEVNDLSNLFRNYIEGQREDTAWRREIEDRMQIVERRTTTPCPPPHHNGNGEAA